jgi:hypothetical protein
MAKKPESPEVQESKEAQENPEAQEYVPLSLYEELEKRVAVLETILANRKSVVSDINNLGTIDALSMF